LDASGRARHRNGKVERAQQTMLTAFYAITTFDSPSREEDVGVKWKMAHEPGADLGMLVGCIIVENHLNQVSRRHLCLDGIEKADEFLMPVAPACSDR